jgi:filamentous hemagglutinin family protein
MKVNFVGFGLTSGILACAIYSTSVNAQVVPDGTLKTTVSQSGNNFTITNGNRSGNNLFHSFSQFSIPSQGSAFFNNASDIQNIFSRITGGNISNIDGLIKANGSANLFLLNPSGIIFGQNARLNIGGSFIATTANSIKFSDEIEFSAVNSPSNLLLSINVPIGLQMGSNSAPIKAEGTGYTNQVYSITRLPNSTELQVKPGKTLALLGGGLQLNGLMLTAPQGQVELGSTNGIGQVNLIPNARGYSLGYDNGQIFGDIQLAQKSLLDVSGFNAGSVELQGRNIRLTDGSFVLGNNYGNLSGGDIRLQASEAIDLIGRSNDGNVSSGVRSETYGIGASGNIGVSTQKFTLQQGAALNNITLGTAPSGNIEIDAKTIEISGFSPINPNGVTSISTLSFASGSAGDILTNGGNLLISAGASLSSLTFGSGSSGKVSIRNQNTTVIGNSPSGFDSAITLATFALGNNKDLILDTGKLQILDGGRIGSSTLFAGDGGNVNINASQAIAISGRNNNNNSAINSSAMRLNTQLRQSFSFLDRLTANAGNLSITTPNLIVTDGGTVTVTSEGTSNAGNLVITANNIQLKNQGLIQAQTESGNGGDITLRVGNLLLMRDRSNITGTAGGSGDGGNININAPIITGLENSDIIANAVKGRGGNIDITTQGIIGLEFRNTLSPKEDLTNNITASSQFNVSGTVQVNNIGVDPNSGLIELPENVTDPSQQIASGCSTNQGSSFVATGRGGIPENPSQEVRSDRTWSDIRDISKYRSQQQVQAQIPQSSETLVQATSWRRNASGKVELVADKSSTQGQQPLTCAAIPEN